MDVTVNEKDPVASDWPAADGFLRKFPNRWGSLSWISARSLIDSVNDVLSRASDGLIDQLRDAWVDRTETGDDRIIKRPTDSRFLIVGDTGEQDPSQYVVSPELARVANDPSQPCDFVLIMSDVIYPAGDVDDYRDGVYRPYRTQGYADKFLVNPPIIAVPGNHDWYDGLSGFMYHFCGEGRLPASAYAPTRQTSVVGRLFRVLWRFPARGREEAEELRSKRPLTTSVDGSDRIIQPGPYFAVQTKHVLLVCIDTGIGGNLGKRQWEWLKRISERSGDKVLITGKPLVANGRIVPCYVGHRSADRGPSVWYDLVMKPEYQYLATIGGDTHNYQKYARRDEVDGEKNGPKWHLVSGGGGAYTHATHPYATADLDSRLRQRGKRQRRDDEGKEKSEYYGLPQTSFPEQPTSLKFFTDLLVPSVWRTLRFLLLIMFGAAAVVGAVLIDQDRRVPLITDLAILGLLLIGLIRAAGSKKARDSRFARFLTGAGGLLLGVLVASVGFRLDSENFIRFAICWLALTGYACIFGLALRRSGWWRPAEDFRRVLAPWAFFTGLAGLSLIGAALAYAASPEDDQWWPAVVAGLIPLVLGSAGWFVRKVHRLAAGWVRTGVIVAPVIQLAVAFVVLLQLARSIGRPWLVGGVPVAIVITIALAAGTGLAVLLITEILALFAAAPIALLVTRRRKGSWSTGWGVIAHATHHLPSLLLLAGTVGWICCVTAGSPYRQAGSGLPVVLFTITGLLLLVGLLRRKLRKAYLVPIVLVLIIATGLALASIAQFDVARFAPPLITGIIDQLTTHWAPRAVLGTAVILVALLVSAVLAHLAFLNALALLVRRSYRSAPYFTDDEEAGRFIAARREPFVVKPDDVSAKAWTGGRITWPGLGEAGGPLQDKVSEVYSSDIPPFHKNFLTLDTRNSADLQIDVHRIAVPKAEPPH